ncbi:MAG: sigma-70 family RNA polymerase sigma factor [Candidatus Hydrogenedentota bacterium]
MSETTEYRANRSTADAEKWLEEHGDYLYRYACFRMRNAHDAEDAVQETLLAALRSVDRFTGSSTMRTWLVGILNHKIADHFRKTAREKVGAEEDTAITSVDDFFRKDGHLAEADTSWDADPGEILERREFHRQLQECLRMLPDRLFRIFTMREMNNLPAEEICRAAGITESNLWVMLHRSRLQLRRCLERSWFGKAAA